MCGTSFLFFKSRIAACTMRGTICGDLLSSYTSIGTKRNTVKNESLRKEDGTFAPAKSLSDWSLERGIRNY